MVKRAPPPPLAYVLRSPTARTEYKGGHREGLELLFVALPDALARRKMLDTLEKVHAKMLAKESTPELDSEQQTAAQVGALASQVHPNSALPPRPYCSPCGGRGWVHTGIDEAPTTECGKCAGTGFQP